MQIRAFHIVCIALLLRAECDAQPVAPPQCTLQPVPDEFFLQGHSWLDDWKKRQLNHFGDVSNRVVMMLIVRTASEWETIAFVRPNNKGSDPLKQPSPTELQLIHASTTDAKLRPFMSTTVELDKTEPLIKDAWKMIKSVRFEAQGDNLTVDTNQIWYLLCRAPSERTVFSYYSAEMAQAINPPAKCDIQRLRESILGLFPPRLKSPLRETK